MPDQTAPRRPSPPAAAGGALAAAPWLSVVEDKLKGMRFGVIQIVVHDSKVVQIERTERTRFDIPPTAGTR